MSWVHGGTGTTSHKEKNTHTLTTFGATAFTAEALRHFPLDKGEWSQVGHSAIVVVSF